MANIERSLARVQCPVTGCPGAEYRNGRIEGCGHPQKTDGCAVSNYVCSSCQATFAPTPVMTAGLMVCGRCNVRPQRIEPICGRVLVGQGSDTSDPIGQLPLGHHSRCRQIHAR